MIFRTPSEKPGDTLQRIGQYLLADAPLVAVADPVRRTLSIYTDDESPEVLTADDTFTPGAILPGYSVAVGELFNV